tara:strand:+ start:761 stop:1144 length:384 start_codon:yes stop_codon:yes gene_type:complete
MKTLVKISKVEDNTVYYSEINRETGKVMIEDYMSVGRFITALQGVYGFQLVKMTKQQAIKVAAMFGAVVTEWDYCKVLQWFSCSTSTVHSYDNGHGYIKNSVGVGGNTQAQLCEQVIIAHKTFKGNN